MFICVNGHATVACGLSFALLCALFRGWLCLGIIEYILPRWPEYFSRLTVLLCLSSSSHCLGGVFRLPSRSIFRWEDTEEMPMTEETKQHALLAVH